MDFMQKDIIVQKLKERGCRITKQRLMLLDIILEEECSCCKEIYYKASKLDNKIGAATVYRMVNTLEEIGAINRKNMYKIANETIGIHNECDGECNSTVCMVELTDNTVYQLSQNKLNLVIIAGLQACGYIRDKEIKTVTLNSCNCGIK